MMSSEQDMRITGYTSMEDRQTWLTAEQLLQQPLDWLVFAKYIDIEAASLQAAMDGLVPWLTAISPKDYLCIRPIPVVVRIRWDDGQPQLLKLLLGRYGRMRFSCFGRERIELHAWTTCTGHGWMHALQQLEEALDDTRMHVSVHHDDDELLAYLRLLELDYLLAFDSRVMILGCPVMSAAMELAQWPKLPAIPADETQMAESLLDDLLGQQ